MRCVHCKSPHHSEEQCPVYARSQATFRIAQKLKSPDFFGASPSPFIGRFGYPNINVGVLTPPEETDTWLYDAPNYWSFSNYNIPQIVDLRSALVNSQFKAGVKARQHRWLGLVQEVGMASRPVDVELSLKKIPKIALNTDPYSAPTGPRAELSKAEVAGNPKIPSKVDRVVGDADLKAGSAVTLLYDKGYSETALQKLLSVGVLGIKEQRKLVPTRWSITATDDIIGRHILEEVKDYDVADYSVYFGSYLGNYYIVCFFPEPWSYELFEVYLPGNKEQFSTDYEFFNGRKDYAYDTTGGYYTVRLAVLEKLRQIKRQSSVFVLRFITNEYTLPLGVFVTREAARKAVAGKPLIFSDKELLLKYVKAFVKKKFNYDAGFLLNKSKLLKNLGKQMRLADFQNQYKQQNPG